MVVPPSGSRVRIAAVATRAVGAGALAAGAGVAGHRLLSRWLPVPGSSRGGLLIAGGSLLLVAGGLRRRSLVAWLVAVGFFAVVVAELDRGTPSRTSAAVVLGVVLLARRDATVLPGRERLESARRLAAVAGVTIVGLGVATALLAGRAVGRPSLYDALHAVVARMVGGDPSWDGSTRLARAVGDALPAATGLAAVVVLAIVLLSTPDVPERDAEVRRRVERLCGSGDGDCLAPFTRRQDKSYVFSDDGRAVIGYRVVFGVCVAGPGPVGAPDAYADTLDAFVRRCDERGWRPSMIGASDQTRGLAERLGLRGIRIGDEALVPVSSFRLDRPPMRNVRQAVQRTRNAGVSVTVHREADLIGGLHELGAELADVVQAWRHGAGELGFAMTLDRLLDATYPDALVFVARHGGHVVGFQRYLLCRGGTGLSLDVMPRRPNAPNGVNERLIAEAIEWGAAHGVDEVSLNFAAFRTLFEAEPSWIKAPLRGAVHLLDPFIKVESLYRFNAKFRPSWVPRHVLYRSPFDLPVFLCAALRVEFGRRDGDPVPTTQGHAPTPLTPTRAPR